MTRNDGGGGGHLCRIHIFAWNNRRELWKNLAGIGSTPVKI
jgi:hypothetical protein